MVADPRTFDASQEPVVRVRRVRIHLGLVLCTVLCVTAFVIELGRALGGNELSWAYVFEWPVLLVFGIVLWWRLLHEGDPGRRRSPSPPTPRRAARDAAEAEQLAALNSYLASLHGQEQNPEPPSNDRQVP